jgi:hypothetical protein
MVTLDGFVIGAHASGVWPLASTLCVRWREAFSAGRRKEHAGRVRSVWTGVMGSFMGWAQPRQPPLISRVWPVM